MINIKNLKKSDVLRVLYNNSQPLGMEFLHLNPADMTPQEAEKIVQSQTYFDYLKGRVMKVDLSSDCEFDECLYDRDNGKGSAQKAINSLISESNK